MPNFRIMVMVSLISFSLAQAAFCADTAPAAPKTPEQATSAKDTKNAKEVKEPTKEDMISNIKTSLDSFSEIASLIPGLKKETDPSGKASYTYQGVKLENLDKEQLTKLYSRVNGETSRIRTDRINKQLENARRLDQLNQQNRQILRTQQPVYRPLQPPTPYPTYNPPKPPPSPPNIPRKQY